MTAVGRLSDSSFSAAAAPSSSVLADADRVIVADHVDRAAGDAAGNLDDGHLLREGSRSRACKSGPTTTSPAQR
jgi:hypothetical protein